MDDDLISKLFGRSFFGVYGGIGRTPFGHRDQDDQTHQENLRENFNDEFSAFFNNGIHRNFQEIEQMMKDFTVGNFGSLKSLLKIIELISILGCNENKSNILRSSINKSD